MHPRVLAERTQSATERIRAASVILAEKAKLDPPELLARRGNVDVAVQTLQFQESVADFLETLADPKAVKRAIAKEREAAAEPFIVVDPEPEPEVESTETADGTEAGGDGTADLEKLPPPEGSEGDVPDDENKAVPDDGVESTESTESTDSAGSAGSTESTGLTESTDPGGGAPGGAPTTNEPS